MNRQSFSTREIWFRCSACERESYCGQEYEELRDPDVLCPYCGHTMKLAAARLDLHGEHGEMPRPAARQAKRPTRSFPIFRKRKTALPTSSP